MSFTTVLVEVKAVLESVNGVQNVHDYPRWSADFTRHKNLFVANGKFEFWQIERLAAPSEASLDGQVFRDHQFRLWYIREIDDATESEKLAQQIVDDVCNAFNQKANLNLDGTADQIKAAEMIEKTDGMVGGVLCNVFQVGIWANEEVTV
jgi:hypothetical protein